MISPDRIPKQGKSTVKDRQPPKNSPGLTPCLTLLPLATGKKEEKLFAKPDWASASSTYKTQNPTRKEDEYGWMTDKPTDSSLSDYLFLFAYLETFV